MIDLIGLRKSFDGQKVLEDCSLHVERGETVVIIGRSGTGKSVLLRHLVGLMRPDSGQVLINTSAGANIRGCWRSQAELSTTNISKSQTAWDLYSTTCRRQNDRLWDTEAPSL